MAPDYGAGSGPWPEDLVRAHIFDKRHLCGGVDSFGLSYLAIPRNQLNHLTVPVAIVRLSSEICATRLRVSRQPSVYAESGPALCRATKCKPNLESTSCRWWVLKRYTRRHAWPNTVLGPT